MSTNFEVIKRYNNSDVFALAAGHLADRARGRLPFRTAWPATDPQLSRDQRIAFGEIGEVSMQLVRPSAADVEQALAEPLAVVQEARGLGAKLLVVLIQPAGVVGAKRRRPRHRPARRRGDPERGRPPGASDRS